MTALCARRFAATFLLVTGLFTTPAAWCDDLDALALESAPTASPAKTTTPASRWYIEAALGHLTQRNGLPDRGSHRISFDLNYSTRLGDTWRLTLSDRLDQVHPTPIDAPALVNSLREAYTSWGDTGGSHVVEFGRINLRNGPAYGFNPTDFFRERALRSVVSADPLALRENRLGTVMLRYQSLWANGGWSIALAPKLEGAASDESFSADLGATNYRDRVLATWSSRLSDRFSGQLLAYWAKGTGTQLGGNFTALVSDALVVHAELAWGKGIVDFGEASDRRSTRQRVAAGLTYTTPSNLALTLERLYNGFGVDSSRWNATPIARRGEYLMQSLSLQDIVSRNAWLMYATQKNLVWRNLDLTALLRINADDHSRLAWAELRYHWPGFDTALQWSTSVGVPGSEYALPALRRSVQVLGAWYF